MKENLITEIKRIQEIMGTETPVLTEQAALLKKLLKSTKGLTDNFEKLFKNASTELSDLATRGTKNTKGEITGAPDEILNRLYSKIDLDEVVVELKSGILAGLSKYETEVKTKMLDSLVKGEPITDEMIQGFKEVYKTELDNLDFLDGVPAINAKLVDDFEKSIREFVQTNKPAKKRFTSQQDVIKQISTDLNIPIEKLRTIPGVSAAMNRAARDMEGKTIGEVSKDFNRVLNEIQANPDFKKLNYRLSTSQIERMKNMISKMLVSPQRKYGFFGGKIVDENGVPVTSVSGTITKSTFVFISLFLSLYLLIKTFYYWVIEGKEPGASVSKAAAESYGSIIGGILEKINEYRDEQGDLSIEESKILFEPTTKKLNKSIENFDFEKIGRGVVKVVDFSDVSPQDYVIVKDSGEVSIYPWTENMDSMDWTDLGSETWKKIKSQLQSIIN